MKNEIQKTKYRELNTKNTDAFSSCFSLSTSHFPLSTRCRGVSLMELLIYIAILSGLMVIISDAFISLSKGRGQTEARSEVNSAMRFASDLIKQDVENASTVTSPLLGTPSGTLSLTVAGVPVVYNVSGGALLRTASGVVATTTGSMVLVDTPVFTRIENFNPYVGASGATTTSVQVSMTMHYTASGSDWTYADTLRTTATLR